MTTRKDLINNMADIETILLYLDDVKPSAGLSDKQVKKAYGRCLWQVLDFIIRQNDKERSNQ